MTSTNDGKDVKIVETSGAKGKIYYIELYKSLECRLTEEQELQARTNCLNSAWRQIHTLCLHSAPNTHPHLLSWLQRHTAKTVLQTEWQSPTSKPIHSILEDGIDSFIRECETAVSTRNGRCLPWEAQLLQRGAWFKTMLGNPWGHLVLRMLLDPRGTKPSDDEVLEWLKEERGVLFVTRLRQLAASKCDDLALSLAASVMDRVRACTKLIPDNEQTNAQEEPSEEPTFRDILTKDAGFTVDVWELLTDMEFVLLHKSDKRSQCIDLAKQTPLRDGYQLVERLQSRLETSPKEKKLWKTAKEAATLIAQVIIARCMVTDSCIGVARTALYCCARSLARLLPASRLPAAAAALAAPAQTARHVHTFASAARAQLHADNSRSAFVCELYVRAITAGMNELERLKLKTEKESEARSHEQTLAAWFCQLGNLLCSSDRIKCECLLTAFSMHPAPDMYERIKALPKVHKYKEQAQDHQETTSEFGSWASDSRSQTNLVKTSETLNMKQTAARNNVLSVAMLTEGEALGLGPELCQDLAVLLSGPRLKTLSWDMDREDLLKNCQAYMERTSGGTRAVTTELKFLNLDPNKYQHLPEEEDNVDDVYYGIEKGYEHLVEFQDPEPEEIWQDAIFSETQSSEESDSSHNTISSKSKRKSKKKSKKNSHISSESETDPLSLADIKEAKKTETQKEKKKERPHSKERKSDKKKAQPKVKNQFDKTKERAHSKEKKEPKQRKNNMDRSQSKEKKKDSSQSKERKKEKRKESKSRKKQGTSISDNSELSKLIGAKVSNEKPDSTIPINVTSKNPPLSRQGSSDLQHFINMNIKRPFIQPGPSLIPPPFNLGFNQVNSGFNEAFLTHLQKTVSPDIFTKTANETKTSDPTKTSNPIKTSNPTKNSNQTKTSSKSNSPVPQRRVRTMQTKVKNIVSQLQQNIRPSSPLVKSQTKTNAALSLPSPKTEPHIAAETTAKHNDIISDEVKQSITKLIKFRKQKSDNTVTPSNSSANTSEGPSPLSSPKSFAKLSDKTSKEERIQSLRDQMNFLLNFNAKRPSQDSFKTTNTPKSTSENHPISSNTSSSPEVTIQSTTKTNSILNKQLTKNEIKDYAQPSKALSNPEQFHDFIKNVHHSYHQAKIVDPLQIVQPRTTSNISPASHLSKQASQMKKVDVAPNTFSRLSYLHKTKQDQSKMNAFEAVPSTSTAVTHQSTAQIDKLISEQKHLKACHNFKAGTLSHANNPERIKKSISKIRTYRKTTDKIDKQGSLNIAQDNQPCFSKAERVPTTPKPAEEQNKPKVSPSSNNLTMQDQAELLLLLHQQSILNTVPNPRSETSRLTNLKPQHSNTPVVRPNVQSTSAAKPTNITESIPLHKDIKITVVPNQTTIQKCQNKKPNNLNGNKNKNSGQKLATPIPVMRYSKNENLIIKSMLNSPSVLHRKPQAETKKEEPSKQITQSKEQPEVKKPYSLKSKEKTDWESVMNLLLAQKTPCRGPNALDITLNKVSFTQKEEIKLARTESSAPKVVAVTTSAQQPVNKSVCVTTVAKQKEVLPTVQQKEVLPTAQQKEVLLTAQPIKKIAQKQVKVEPKPILNRVPSFTKQLSKDEDPFVSGIPNSDYDLLEELMDDELRKEIGELSSDDDTFNPRSSLNKNQIKSRDQKFVSKQCKTTSIERKSIVTPNHNIVDNTHIIKTVHVQTTSMTTTTFTKTKEAALSSSNVNVAYSRLQQNLISPVIANIPGPVNAANYIVTQQQPQVQNMFLIGSDVVYDPFTPVQLQNTSIASNTILAVNSTPIGLYQTTQIVAPIVNPVLVQHRLTVQHEDLQMHSNMRTIQNTVNIKHQNTLSIDSETTQTQSQVANSLSPTNIKYAVSTAEVFQNNYSAECKPSNSAHTKEPMHHVQSQSLTKIQKEVREKGKELLVKQNHESMKDSLEGIGEKSSMLQKSQSQSVQRNVANLNQETNGSKQITLRRQLHSKTQNTEQPQKHHNQSSQQFVPQKIHRFDLNTAQILKVPTVDKQQKSNRNHTTQVCDQKISQNKTRPKRQSSEMVQKSQGPTDQQTEENLGQAQRVIVQSPEQKQTLCKKQNIEKPQTPHPVSQKLANSDQPKQELNQTVVSEQSKSHNFSKHNKSKGIKIQGRKVTKKKPKNKNKKRIKSPQDDTIVYQLSSQRKNIESEFRRRTRSHSVPTKEKQSPPENMTQDQCNLDGIKNLLNIKQNEDCVIPCSEQDKEIDDESIKLTNNIIDKDQTKIKQNIIKDALDFTEVNTKVFIPKETRLKNLDSILQKQSERKVLAEVNEKLTSTVKKIETKLCDTKNEKRIKEKRFAIINRQIAHQSYYPSIPLTYSPLTIVNDPVKASSIPIITASLDGCLKQGLSIETKAEIHSENRECALTPDSQDDVENKSEEMAVKDNDDDKPQCRRILLRSSNKHIDFEKVVTQVKPKKCKKVKSDVKLDSKAPSTTNKRSNSSKQTSMSKTKIIAAQGKPDVDCVTPKIVNIDLEETHTVLASLLKKPVTNSQQQEVMTNIKESSQDSGKAIATSKPCLIPTDEPSRNLSRIDNVTLKPTSSFVQKLEGNYSLKSDLKNKVNHDEVSKSETITSTYFCLNKSQISSLEKSVSSSETVNNEISSENCDKNKPLSEKISTKKIEDPVGKNKEVIHKESNALVPAQEIKTGGAKENLTNSILVKETQSSDPNVRCARIQLPNKKAFKVTITGGKSISYNTILENPQIRKYLLSSIDEDIKLYTVNIPAKTKTANTGTVSTTNLSGTNNNTVDTIDLLSDDEENTSINMCAFKTEYGNYSVKNVDNETYKKHQAKFLQKCSITLHRHVTEKVMEEPIIINSPPPTEISDPEEVFLSSDTDSASVIDLTNAKKTPSSVMNKEVIEIDDSSSDDDLRQYILPIEINNSVSVLKTLNIKLPQGLEAKNLKPENTVADSNIGNMLELKNNLLQDLDLNLNVLDGVLENTAAINILKNDDTFSESNKTTVTKQNCPEMIIRQCSVKLVRCDPINNGPTPVESSELDTDKEGASSVVSSRRGSFSILNELPLSFSANIIDGLNNCFPQNICYDTGRSSPVMEVYDLLTSFVTSKQDLHEKKIPLLCVSEYFTTKTHYHLLNKSTNICDVTNHSILRYATVPSLVTLMTLFINKTESTTYDFCRSPNLKRKLIAQPGHVFTMKRSRKGFTPGSSRTVVSKELNCNNCGKRSMDNHGLLNDSNINQSDSNIIMCKDSEIKFPSLDNEHIHRENKFERNIKLFDAVKDAVNNMDTTLTENSFNTNKNKAPDDHFKLTNPDEDKNHKILLNNEQENKHLDKTWREVTTKNRVVPTNSPLTPKYEESYKKEVNISKLHFQNEIYVEKDLTAKKEKECISKSFKTGEIQNKSDCSTVKNSHVCEGSPSATEDNSSVLSTTNKQSDYEIQEETNIEQKSTRNIFINNNIALEVTFVDENSDVENNEALETVNDVNYQQVKTLKELAQYVLDHSTNEIVPECTDDNVSKTDVKEIMNFLPDSKESTESAQHELNHNSINNKLNIAIDDAKSSVGNSEVVNIVEPYNAVTQEITSNEGTVSKMLDQYLGNHGKKKLENEVTFGDVFSDADCVHVNEAKKLKDLARDVLNHKSNNIELEITIENVSSDKENCDIDHVFKTVNETDSDKIKPLIEAQQERNVMNHNIDFEVTIDDEDSDNHQIVDPDSENVEKEKVNANQLKSLKELSQRALDKKNLNTNAPLASSKNDKCNDDLKDSNYAQILKCLNSITSSKLATSEGKPQQKMAIVYKGSDLFLNGVLHEDPEIGTCYLFPYVENENNTIDAEVLKATKEGLFEVVQQIDVEDDILENENSAKEITDTVLSVLTPKMTYSNKSFVTSSSQFDQRGRRGKKRKLQMGDTKISRTKYRKGKNIEYPKFTAATILESTYQKEFKHLLNYISNVKFSYNSTFHQGYVDCNLHYDWPIKGVCEAQDNIQLDSNTCIFEDNNFDEVVHPLQNSLADEISIEYDEEENQSCKDAKVYFNMGFGEGSGRVLHNSENVGSLQKFSAATLSDVKHSQPFLLFEDYEDVDCLTRISSKQDQLEKLKQHMNYVQIREKVRIFFRNITSELNREQKDKIVEKKNKFNNEKNNKSNLIWELCKPDYIKPFPVKTLVNVVQVGQLPVSTAAQNPVTCDPRVTQVSDASPSQCSVENSPRDDSQSGTKTEYTELTTADLSMPLMQNYSHHNEESHLDDPSLLPPENIPIKAEIKEETSETSANSADTSELLDLRKPMPKGEPENNISQDLCANQMNNDNQVSNANQMNNANQINNTDYPFDANSTTERESDVQMLFKSEEKESTDIPADNKNMNGSSDKTDQLAHAMNAAGITTQESMSNNRAQALVNILSQKIGQATTNNYTKTTSINATTLQQALAQFLPPAMNQGSENSQSNQNASVGPQVLHIVQSKNGSGNQITLLDNSQQSVINNPNSTSVLHIVQNKSSPQVSNSGGTNVQQTNSYSGLSLVEAGLQQAGNQLLHIVNTGNQKNGNTGQLLKRVNLLTNLTNVQGTNEQKMVQFVCKSADGKSIQLNGPHQRSMVLRLQPIETPTVQNSPAKPPETQDHSPSVNAANSTSVNDPNNQQEIKSRSVYEENYAKFIQSSSSKPSTGSEKSTSLPKFNQAFGKPVFQDGNQKSNDINTNSNSLPSVSNSNTETNEAPTSEGSMNMDQINQMNNPPSLLQQKTTVPTSQAQQNLMQQIKQTLGPMNIQTMHGGVIYTRQIPVNIGGGQTINLITVPSTELMDDSQKNPSDSVKFISHNDMEPSIIKIVPQTNAEGQSDDMNNQARSGENQNLQPQPVLTQMRIKLPMLSKAPQMVAGTRVVRPSFFQIQRNVISGANQPVYQQLVLTTAPPLGQQTIRLPTQTQTQTRPVKLPSESQSSSESQMSSSTLEQLREFDMVLEQVKERSTVQPNGNSTNSFSGKIHSSSTDTTDGSGSVSSNTTDGQSVLYSIGVNQTANIAYVTRKAPVSTPTTSSFVRSPDSSGIADSPTSSTIAQISHGNSGHNEPSNEASHHKSSKTSSKSKSRPKASSNPPTAMKINNIPPKPSTQKPLEDEQTTQRILYILAEYKEQVENSPDKDKPAPRRRTNPPINAPGSSKRKKSSSGSRRPGGRDMSPIHGDETCRTMGSEDSSCGTSQGDCTENCLDSHSPQDSPRKVARRLTFEQDNATPSTTPPQPRPQQPPRNVIVADGQTITVARGTAGKPATAVLMPANYILPVSMVKGGQQIAIVTNRGPKLLTVGGGEAGTTNALLLQRLIGPAGLKPMLARPGVRHVRLPTAALHNLQAFNLAASATTVNHPDSTASSATGSQDVLGNRVQNPPWTETQGAKLERGSSPDASEPWNLPSSADNEYNYEDVRAEQLDRTVLDAIPDRYSPDMEAQRIFDKMFDTDTKKSYIVDSHDDSPRCGYDIDASDDDKAYQVVHKKDGTQQHRRLTHVSAAALRHKYAILEHELRLQKSLSEECEDLGVDSPSASELFPEAELLFAASPAQDHGNESVQRVLSPPAQTITIPQPDIDDQIATDELLQQNHLEDQTELEEVNLGIDVAEELNTPLDHEEFARSHPNTTFHSEPTDDEVVPPFTITELKARHITQTIFHANRAPATVLMTAPQTTVISQATAENIALQNTVKYADIDNMINSIPGPHTNTINLSSVLVKDDGLTRFDSILTDSRELHLTNTASAIVHATGNATQVIRRVCYDEKRDREHFLMDEPGALMGEDAKMVAEDTSRDALQAMADVDDDRSSPERHTELFWESNSASERSESRRPLDFSSDSDKCCKSPSLDETNSTDSSGVGTHMRLDSVIKEARGVERSCSAEGSSADDTHPPLRTYPAAKRMYHTESDVERSLSGKTREGERSPDSLEVRRRASGRGVVKRGCLCCNGSPTPRPKKSRPRKPNTEFN